HARSPGRRRHGADQELLSPAHAQVPPRHARGQPTETEGRDRAVDARDHRLQRPRRPLREEIATRSAGGLRGRPGKGDKSVGDAESSASKTALMVCAYRARASRWPRPLFNDPWADSLAGPEGHDMAKRTDLRFPPMELWLALRVSYFDRVVTSAIDRLRARPGGVPGARSHTPPARVARARARVFAGDRPATPRPP